MSEERSIKIVSDNNPDGILVTDKDDGFQIDDCCNWDSVYIPNECVEKLIDFLQRN